MGTLNLGSSGAINSTDLNISGRVAKPAHPYILYRPNATKTIAHNSFDEKLDHFGTQEVAQGGLSFNAGTITVPVAGLYRVRVKVNSNAEGRFGNDCAMWVRVNGSDYLGSNSRYFNFAAGGAPSSSNLWYHPVELDMCVNLNLASDYMQVYLYQNTGSTQTLHGTMGFLECYLIG